MTTMTRGVGAADIEVLLTEIRRLQAQIRDLTAQSAHDLAIEGPIIRALLAFEREHQRAEIREEALARHAAPALRGTWDGSALQYWNAIAHHGTDQAVASDEDVLTEVLELALARAMEILK